MKYPYVIIKNKYDNKKDVYIKQEYHSSNGVIYTNKDELYDREKFIIIPYNSRYVNLAISVMFGSILGIILGIIATIIF